MANKDKVERLLNDEEYVEIATQEYLRNRREIKFEIVHNEEPENYVRERYTGRGNRFYNAKEGIMKDMKGILRSLIPGDIKIELEKLLKKEDAVYYVHLEVDFYLKTPDGDSIVKTILKEKKVIRPAIRPDLDNYDKLLIDVLHDLVYDDDKRLVSIKSNKYYSMNSRTEIKITIEIIQE
jgi:Holliday junction resolvase RusA-like endonuclease